MYCAPLEFLSNEINGFNLFEFIYKQDGIKKPAHLDLHCFKNSALYSKTCVKCHSQKDQILVFKSNYCLMQVQGEHSAIFLTFIKLPFVIKIFVLSIFEWPFYTDFTV